MMLHPQVTYLPKSRQCDGWMRKYPWKRGMCKNPAKWKFRARRHRYPDSKSGVYCWRHLWTQWYTNVEYDKFKAWWLENLPKDAPEGAKDGP